MLAGRQTFWRNCGLIVWHFSEPVNLLFILWQPLV
jgi:hypothetical protein